MGVLDGDDIRRYAGNQSGIAVLIPAVPWANRTSGCHQRNHRASLGTAKACPPPDPRSNSITPASVLRAGAAEAPVELRDGFGRDRRLHDPWIATAGPTSASGADPHGV
jgi:hypothetical protein